MGGSPPDEARLDAGAPPGKPARLIVAARLALVLLAGWAAWSGLVRLRPPTAGENVASARYVCPMHPGLTAAAPGECPICGMALRRVLDEGGHPAEAEPPPALTGSVDRVRRRVLSYDVRAPAWVRQGALRAHLYDEDVATLAAGEEGLFHPALFPGETAIVHLTAAPPAPWDSSTSEVQFELAAGAPAFAPGTAGWVELRSRPRTALVVPASAVLQSADGPCVLAAADDGTFARRPIRTGRTAAGVVSVVAGLREGERVMIRGAYFLDSSLRLEPPGGASR
jgi:heavy metal-binding protein